jgi:gliding motility-associated-like protein
VAVTDANNCVFSDTLSIIAPDSILTDLSITQPSCSESSDGEIIISASGGTGSLYYLINNTGSTGMASGLGQSSYLIQIIDDNGCSVDTIVDLIALRDECLSIPNYFSPNDDGVNDVWNILGIDLANYTLVIFNVTGQELYRTESQNYQPWDGQFNGRVLPDGDYYYVLESEIQQQAGYVTLRK